MGKIYQSITELIGSTPIMRLNAYSELKGLSTPILAKLEYFNPTGSAKDRIALSMIEEAEKRGELKKGSVIIEPTSGNTGIGIAAIGAAKGYRVIITMPETMSVERRNLMKAYGAEVELTDGAKGMSGAIEKARELAAQYKNSFVPGQFDNPDNALAHYKTTGAEIWNDADGKVDIFVAGIGTGGTLSGTGKYLKEKNPSIKIVGVEPYDSPVITKGVAGAHKIQGIGAGFIPKNFDASVCDETLAITNEDAFNEQRNVALSEGLLLGVSSGAALRASVELAKRPENKGKNIVVLLPDTGERYLSSMTF